MTGNLFKSASSFALVAVAGLMAGGVAARAADLGGNCCADLEERVAELESTTARKGNRKVKLTVSGHINEAVLFWDDGRETNAYVVSNNNSRTRFRFVGDAKINADWSAGYLLEFGLRYADSRTRTQSSASGSSVVASNAANVIDIRHSAWYLDSKTFGRVWVGNTSTAADSITQIKLSNNINLENDPTFQSGGFFLRNANGTLASATRANLKSGSLNGNVGEGDRANTVKYVAPVFAGFTFSAAWGSDDQWDVALRYAGEFSGFRLAGGVGYQEIYTSFGAGNGGCTNAGPGGVVSATESTSDCNTIGLSASILHVKTGLFVNGSWGRLQDNNRRNLNATARNEDSHWFIQGGIEQNWFGFGKTTLHGQYINSDTGASIFNGARVAATGLTGAGAGTFLAGAQGNEFGFGVTQEISAAAMDIYVNYLHSDIDVQYSVGGGRTGAVDANIRSFDSVIAGAIIRF